MSFQDFKTLHVFNPEHDFALAIGPGPYTPPREILKIKNLFSLLPATYARNGDFIVVPEELNPKEMENLPFFNLLAHKKLVVVKPGELVNLTHQIDKVSPWGWDHAVKNFLLSEGIKENLLPDNHHLNKIRDLSHRRIVIPFRETFSQISGFPIKFMPQELSKVEEVEKYLKIHPHAFFKAPWSSSGRGIVVSNHITLKGLFEWSHGIIRRQGSILAEPAWDKQLDFATEWRIKDGRAQFLGLSVFNASSRGKYHGNVSLNQPQLVNLIREKTKQFNPSFIEAQKLVLEKIIAPYYTGPLGIDMLADSSGEINPCVEINLRMTMGIIELAKTDPDIPETTPDLIFI